MTFAEFRRMTIDAAVRKRLIICTHDPSHDLRGAERILEWYGKDKLLAIAAMDGRPPTVAAEESFCQLVKGEHSRVLRRRP
jgi:hypothetical protein